MRPNLWDSLIDHTRLGVAQPVQERLLAEVGEERAGDEPGFERAKKGEKNLRHFGQEEEEHVPGRAAQFGQHIGKTRTLALQVAEGVVGSLAVRPQPAHGRLLGQAQVALVAGAKMAEVELVVRQRGQEGAHKKRSVGWRLEGARAPARTARSQD